MGRHMSAEELEALSRAIEEEDAKAEADPEVPREERDILAYEGFANHGVRPRELGDLYE